MSSLQSSRRNRGAERRHHRRSFVPDGRPGINDDSLKKSTSNSKACRIGLGSRCRCCCRSEVSRGPRPALVYVQTPFPSSFLPPPPAHDGRSHGGSGTPCRRQPVAHRMSESSAGTQFLGAANVCNLGHPSSPQYHIKGEQQCPLSIVRSLKAL